MIAGLGLLVGVILGLILQPEVPLWLEPYLPIAVVAALDAVFGALRAFLDGIFDDKVFVISFISNVLIAALIVYLGDKLGVVTRAVAWLAEDGLFVANLDADNLRDEAGGPLGRRGLRLLREAGLEYDTRRLRIACRGRKTLRLPFTYVGADDAAGPNYTRQPAVHSRYRPAQS